MALRPRDEFSQLVKRTLAHRVGLICSNPDCRAATSDPQIDPSSSVNVGVAAHITGAAPGGPRFNSRMSEKDRRSASNGIWLCQNCAKLIDNDLQSCPVNLLWNWKGVAEEEARSRIGKTSSKAGGRSVKQAAEDLQREHNLRDDLHRDLLKISAERMGLPRVTSRVSKFLHSEIIVHRIDDRTYPNIDEKPGISAWFKLEILDFYHGGLECILDLQYALVDSETRKWSLISYERSKSSFPPRFSKEKVFVTGKIPCRDILHYDIQGDQYYPQPHLYCAFAESGEPYEGRGFFLLDDGREWELQTEDRVEPEALLLLAKQRGLALVGGRGRARAPK
jgi:hypothetical protein